MPKNGFQALNFVQFIDALNENLFKLLIIFFLIHLRGIEETATITTVIGGLFILPFVLFSSLGGVFGDRWSKTSVIRITRVLQILVTFGAIFCAALNLSIPMYILFILMASLAAIFGPSKYGIIGELIGRKDMMRANSYIAAFSLFGVILGTFFASVIDSVLSPHFGWMFSACFVLAVAGTIISLKIPQLPAANPEKKGAFFLYSELYDSFVAMRKTPLLLLATIAYSYFFFLGAFVQINIIPFGVEILRMDPATGGYLFIFCAIGMGVGSLIAAKLRLNLRLLAPSCAVATLSCFLFVWFSTPYWLNGIWLLFLGVGAGIFIVPAQAFVVLRSSPEDRARNFGTANFLSFLFALLAALCLYLFNTVFDWNSSQSFYALGWLNVPVVFWLYWQTRRNGSAPSNNR